MLLLKFENNIVFKMKHFFPFILITLSAIIFSCENKTKDTSATTVQQDSIIAPPVSPTNMDSLLTETGKQVLLVLKNKDYKGLAAFFDDQQKVRFSPYGYIDTVSHRQFSKAEFDTLVTNNKPTLWGSYDGSGDPMQLTPTQYFEKFVYNADFLNAEKTAIDSVIGKGNSLVNIDKIYPGARFIEYHFSGFDKKYGGMDWTSLRLVFKETGRSYKLIAIVHDQWTI